MKIKKTRSVHVDEGEYTAMITKIEECKGKKGGIYYRWTFQLKDPREEGEIVDEKVTVNGQVGGEYKEGWKLDKWLKAVGINAAVEEEIELDDAIGQVVRVIVADTEKDDRVYSNVTTVMRAIKKAAPKPAPTDEEEAPPAQVTKKPATKPAAKPAQEEETSEEPEEKPASKPVKSDTKQPNPALFDFDKPEEEEEAEAEDE